MEGCGDSLDFQSKLGRPTSNFLDGPLPRLRLCLVTESSLCWPSVTAAEPSECLFRTLRSGGPQGNGSRRSRLSIWSSRSLSRNFKRFCRDCPLQIPWSYLGEWFRAILSGNGYRDTLFPQILAHVYTWTYVHAHPRMHLGSLYFWRAEPPQFWKKRSENLGWNFGVQPIPRVAPRVAPRIGFSHKLGHECHSENCSENTPEFRELLREWPFHSESVFWNWGGSQVSEYSNVFRHPWQFLHVVSVADSNHLLVAWIICQQRGSCIKTSCPCAQLSQVVWRQWQSSVQRRCSSLASSSLRSACA